MSQVCLKCQKKYNCKKSSNVENYSLRPGCSEFIEELDLNTKLVLIRLFSEIEGCLDNRSISHLAPGEIYSNHIFEGELEEDIANLRKKYLGDYMINI